MKKYIYEQDPGHGWLGVPRAELMELGIENLISTYSYFDPHNTLVWLEEDCDMGIFLLAKVCGTTEAPANDGPVRDKVHGWMRDNVQEKYVTTTRIRSLPSFAQFNIRRAL